METVQETLPQEQTGAVKPPKKKRRWVKPLVITLVVLLLIFVFAIRPMLGAGRKMISDSYMTQASQVREMTVTVGGTGTINPIDSYKVAALATGEVLDAPFEEGEQVEKGQILFQIEAEDAQNAVAQAELGVRQAQLAYENAMNNTNPTAQGSGVVEKLYVKKGDSVAPGSPIADIADTSVMTLSASFHSADAANIYPGQQGTVTVEGTMETLPCTVESVAAADQVGLGGALVRQVKVRVNNPGALTTSHSGSVSIGGADCAAGGPFEANLQQTVTAASGGTVEKLNVSQGSRVSAGTVLLTLGGSAAGTTLDNAALAVENAQLSLERAMNAMDNYTVTAPISGTVIEKNFKTGDTVENASLTAAGGNLAVIYDMSTMTLKTMIDELDINKIREGQEVDITCSAVEGEHFRGVVDKVSLNGTTVSGRTTYPVTINLVDVGALKPGMNVSADIIVDQVGEVLSVPVEAVRRGAEKPYVLVASPDDLSPEGKVTDPGKLERREVTLGRNDDSYIEIKEGLEAGEVVVWEAEITNPFAMMMGMNMGV